MYMLWFPLMIIFPSCTLGTLLKWKKRDVTLLLVWFFQSWVPLYLGIMSASFCFALLCREDTSYKHKMSLWGLAEEGSRLLLCCRQGDYKFPIEFGVSCFFPQFQTYLFGTLSQGDNSANILLPSLSELPCTMTETANWHC